MGIYSEQLIEYPLFVSEEDTDDTDVFPIDYQDMKDDLLSDYKPLKDDEEAEKQGVASDTLLYEYYNNRDKLMGEIDSYYGIPLTNSSINN